MRVVGWGPTPYPGEIVFPDLPQGQWEVAGTQYVRRHHGFANVWEIQCVLRSRQDQTQMRTEFVPSSWLPFLVPGTIWRNGELSGDIHRFDKPLKIDLDIDASSVTDIDVYDRRIVTRIREDGSEEQLRRYTVPPTVCRFIGVDRRRFRLVGVRQGDDPLAVIMPAHVVNHFYFCGVSSDMSDALFAGSIKRLYDHTRSKFLDAGRRHFLIAPRPDITDSDCWVIARIAASHHGSAERRAFFRFQSSLVRASINRQPGLPKALFPFEGQTSLLVFGRWFDSEDEDGVKRRRLYVKRIISCSAAFPIDELTILRDGVESSGEDDSEKPPFYILKRDPTEKLKLLKDLLPNPLMPPLTVEVEPTGSRFKFLEDKRPTLVYDVKELETRRGIAIEGAEPSDIGSTLPGTDPTSDAHPVKAGSLSEDQADAAGEEPEEKPKAATRSRGTDNFTAVMDILATAGAQVRPVAVTKQTYPCQAYRFGLFPTMPGSRSWEMLEEPTPDGRVERLALVADVRVGLASGAIYYIEPRNQDEATGCIMLAVDPRLTDLTQRQHFHIVDKIRTLRRVWGNDIQDSAIRRAVSSIPECARLQYTRLEHRHLEPEVYAEKIFAKLSDLSKAAQVRAEGQQ